MSIEITKTLKHNLIVNLLDGAFFGMALGFASFITIIPLFVSTMTDSALLIGLIPAIHSAGWQLPQLLIAKRVSRQKRLLPMVLLLSIHERLPFVGLAVIAWFLPALGNKAGLILTFLLLIWQGLGGGVTATPWQAMIGKIIPSDWRGTFLGSQSSALSLLASIGAVFAGYILSRLDSPIDFTVCFLLSGVGLVISWIFLALTKEAETPKSDLPLEQTNLIKNLKSILKRDVNFRWFLVARMLSQIAAMGFAFYTVYAVRHHGVSEVEIGLMTGVLLGTQIAMNPLVGWLSDRWSHRALLEIGIVSAALSALTAWWAPAPGWFYLVFFLTGIANAAIWTVSLIIILEFGTEAERPTYIGMANTLIAPFAILSPFLGGFLADRAGYPAAFLASVVGGLATLVVLQFRVRDPRKRV